MKTHAMRFGLGLLVATVLFALFVLKWASTPVRPDTHSPDPAVSFANSHSADGPNYSEAYHSYRGNSLHYVEAGEGDLVLFLHGFPSYWLSSIRQMDALKGRYRVVAVDGLGAGRSDAPLAAEHYSLERMSAHIIRLVDDLGADTVHLVGHDWGAAFAFGLAQRYPERVLSVTGISAPPLNVLLDSFATDPAAASRTAYIERLKRANPVLIVATGGHRRVWTGAYEPLVSAGHMTEQEGALFRKATGDPRRINAHINWYRANIPAPADVTEQSFWPSRTARLTMPAQLIWGKNDRIFAPAYAERMAALADDIRLLPLDDVGHWPHFERSRDVAAAVEALIEDASVGR